MTNAFIMLFFMAAGLFGAAYRKGKHRGGVQEAMKMFWNVLPLLICAFIIVGFLDLLLPRETLQSWMGDEAGWRGLVTGSVIGALVQGGPFAFFPLFDAVFRDSVTTGTAVAMITAWGMINVGHLPYELAFLGPRFMALKYSLYLAVPALTGALANLLFGP